MFTVLHRDDNGVETLHNVNFVQFVPMTEENGDSGGVHMMCGPTEAAHGVHVGRIAAGSVFVMNEQGATVARYSMRAVSPPKLFQEIEQEAAAAALDKAA